MKNGKADSQPWNPETNLARSLPDHIVGNCLGQITGILMNTSFSKFNPDCAHEFFSFLTDLGYLEQKKVKTFQVILLR